MDEVSKGGKKAKKKKSASTHTIKNFGTALNIAKAKSSSSIAWPGVAGYFSSLYVLHICVYRDVIEHRKFHS